LALHISSLEHIANNNNSLVSNARKMSALAMSIFAPCEKRDQLECQIPFIPQNLTGTGSFVEASGADAKRHSWRICEFLYISEIKLMCMLIYQSFFWPERELVHCSAVCVRSTYFCSDLKLY
jgi:hypothetical protein